MPDHAWTCQQCEEKNPPFTEVCRNCNAPPTFVSALPESHLGTLQTPTLESSPKSLEQKLRTSAKFAAVGIALPIVGFSAVMLGPKGADSAVFRILVFFAGACEIAAIPLLLIGAIRGLYFSVRLYMEKRNTALVWLFLLALPLGAILLLLGLVAVTYRGP